MRVLYVSRASRSAGRYPRVAELSRLAEVTVVVPAAGPSVPAGPPQEPGYRVVPLPARLRGHTNLHVYRGLESVLTPGRFDLVHVDEEPYSFAAGQAVGRAWAVGVPAVFFAGQNVDRLLLPPFGSVRTGVFRRATAAIAGSEEAAAVIRRRGFRGAVATIPQTGVDPERFRPDPLARGEIRRRLGVPEEGFLVGYVGRLVPERGLGLLLEALEDVPAAELLLVGDGPERHALLRRAAAGPLAGRVHFAGGVPPHEVPRWMTSLDCLVLASLTTRSWKEQYGRVLVEAMASGVPVLGSDSGEIPRVIGDAGRRVPEGDVTALARELGGLAESPLLRAELGRRGRERVLDRYTEERLAQRTAAFWARVLEGRGQRAPVGSRQPR